MLFLRLPKITLLRGPRDLLMIVPLYDVLCPHSKGSVEAIAGMVRVNATFSEPGDYILRAQADNWRAFDSGAMDQCCWSNGYVRVHVTP